MDTPLHRRLIGWLQALVGVLAVFLVAIAVLQVTLRYLFAAPLGWVEEVSVMALIWLSWIGAVLCWLAGSHIAVDLLPPMRAAARRWFAIAIDALALVFGLALCIASFWTLDLFSNFDLGTFEIPASIKYYPVTAGSAGLALAALINLWSRFKQADAGG
ncbi:MAG TPA: TRAP transporter small permease subunit [Hyphomicrobiaceae bacterium]|jgi:TRAP-type C4-dicarboxylate transport system permease small subunit|nr:TRAP transporter small permease subunit [Hyphomicrobiaceae bacterium]